jgi:hypothetical protein
MALLDVCNNDTIIAEYDVVRNKDSMRINRKTIRDEKRSGERDVPRVIKKKGDFFKLSHSTSFTESSLYLEIFFQIIAHFQISCVLCTKCMNE